jgi:hypothetical protein
MKKHFENLREQRKNLHNFGEEGLSPYINKSESYAIFSHYASN